MCATRRAHYRTAEHRNLTETTVTALDRQDGILEAIRCHSHRSGDERQLLRHLFLFIGADPNTGWLSSRA
jgi:thioredoxin reductase (NADPH)